VNRPIASRPVIAEVDVCVVGAGSAGSSAAIAAARGYLPDGGVVGIPYRTLIVRDAANVLVAGRCLSATHDAHASVGSMAQCMAMGQAAGSAAGLAVAARCDPRDVPVGAIIDRLYGDGAILETGDSGVAAA
jgi:hypothetical protein